MIYDVLDKPKKIYDEILNLEQQMKAKRYSLLPSGIAYDGVRVQTSPGDSLSGTMATIADTMMLIKALEDEMHDAQRDVRKMACKLDRIYSDILIERYCYFKSYAQIAREYNITEDTARRRKHTAINLLLYHINN